MDSGYFYIISYIFLVKLKYIEIKQIRSEYKFEQNSKEKGFKAD
jgi:hypothetical protein